MTLKQHIRRWLEIPEVPNIPTEQTLELWLKKVVDVVDTQIRYREPEQARRIYEMIVRHLEQKP